MKLLFLDIDGVVNSHDWWKRRPKREPGHDREAFIKNEFDPEACALVREIIDLTGCKVVLSSTWRLSEDGRNEVKEHCCDFIDVTGECTSRIRGAEIHMWIQNNLSIDERKHLKYAILDDDSDMLLWQKDNYFQTDYRLGITKEIADAVIQHLGTV